MNLDALKQSVASGVVLARPWICVVLLMCASASTSARSVEEELLARITEANQALRDIEKTIATKSGRLQAELSAKENEVKSLRAQAAVLQRATDEQLMSVEELEKRVEQWSVQGKYQKHMLASFVGNMDLPDVVVTDDGSKLIRDDLLKLAHKKINQFMSPEWKRESVVTLSGQYRPVRTLAVGPVEVALEPGTSLSGLIDRTNGEMAQLVNVFSEEALTEVQSLFDRGQGNLTFDPTLGNAAKLQGNRRDLWSHLKTGGVWAIPIVFFGLLAFVVSLMKAVQLARLPKVQEQFWPDGENGTQAGSGRIQSIGKLQQRLLDIAQTVPVSSQRDDMLVACLMENRHRLERYMGAIATTAAVAPLLGLLGTVSGMITTFKMMTIFGSGDASTVSGGISEALVTTELGLIVAIPSLIVSALLNRNIKSYHQKLEAFAVRLSKIPPRG